MQRALPVTRRTAPCNNANMTPSIRSWCAGVLLPAPVFAALGALPAEPTPDMEVAAANALCSAQLLALRSLAAKPYDAADVASCAARVAELENSSPQAN
jgi:hypothetical protein